MNTDILITSDAAKERLSKGISGVFKNNLKPAPKLSLVEWADKYRVLDSKSSAEAGQWRTSRVEVARGVMEAVTDPDIQKVTAMCCTQLLKTELLLNTIGYYIHQQPAPIIFMQPTTKMAESVSKDRLMPMLQLSPVLKNKISSKSRDEHNTILHKQFAGGQLTMVGANSPADLASRPCQIVLCDEVDKYPSSAGEEGDPIKLLQERAATFGNRSLFLSVCSPTVEGSSRIEYEYLRSDQRVFEMPCPHCDEYKERIWSDVVIPKDESGEMQPDKAAIVCTSCGTEWSEQDRRVSIQKGRWRATKPEVKGHAGFRCNKLASPWEELTKIAAKFVDAQGSPDLLKTFYNTQMAQTWKETGDAPNWKSLYDRRENYQIGVIPKGGLMLVGAMDVQKDYVQWEIVAYGRKKESWSIDKGVISGSIESQEVKDAIYELLDTRYKNELGVEMTIEAFAIDSGFNTNEVYSTVRQYGSDRLVAVKGMANSDFMVGVPKAVDVTIGGQRLAGGLKLWPIGTHRAKEQVYRWLNAEGVTDEQKAAGRTNPTGFCHFPMWEQDYFEQLTAEQLLRKQDKRGFTQYEWIKVKERNEQLDIRVYCLAMAYKLGIDRMSDKHWEERERFYGYRKKLEEATPATHEATAENNTHEETRRSVQQQPRRHRRKGSWIQR